MQIKSIDMASIVPTGRQRVVNGLIDYDEYNKLALVPSLKHREYTGDAVYVDTVSRTTYEINVFEREFNHEHLTVNVPKNIARSSALRKVLFEKTLQGNVYIALFNDSSIYWVRNCNWTQLLANGIDSEIIDMTFAFNRLIVATRDKVLWSIPGLVSPDSVTNGLANIPGDFKQSDSITQEYIGIYADGRKLYLMTKGGCEIWMPTQDASNPFIYESAKACNIEASENEFALMSEDSHRLGIYSFAENKWLTDDRWELKPENLHDLKVFKHSQNGHKMLAIYELDKMWLCDLKHGLMTMQSETFWPFQELGAELQNMQINLLLDKGVYGSLFLQLGKFPEEIQFYIDSLYAKHAPLIAFERDDVIKTMNIGKLTVDTPLELNFKGRTAIYSIGLQTNSKGG